MCHQKGSYTGDRKAEGYDRINAPAETDNDDRSEESGSPLGAVPHQLRGQLSSWRTTLVEGTAYDKCTGCSEIVSTITALVRCSGLIWGQVVNTYRENGFNMLLRAFNETDYLEKLTGLDELYKESEAKMEDLDWDEGSQGSF